MSKFTITLRNGNVLSDLTMNGNMFVSKEAISKDDLDEEALASVTIVETPDEGEEITKEYENMVCDGVLEWPEGYLFNLREQSDDEKRFNELRQDVADALTGLLEFITGEEE
ncbi:MAG: hypothetical protein IKH75_01235 [Ruminococcus sp.]|nr:hypothetical protein [Ruminococcus sp.]